MTRSIIRLAFAVTLVAPSLVSGQTAAPAASKNLQ